MKQTPLLSLLIDRFPDYEREELYSLVLCGDVRVDGGRVRDPKLPVPRGADIRIEGRRFVSRGGDKLDHALSAFGIDVRGKVIIDAGSSTGGFTDCLLKRGAAAVHAVDVGYNLLAYELRNDPRVILHERTSVTKIWEFSPRPHLAVADLSFRSITGAASHLISQTEAHCLVSLVKPQFEWKNPSPSFDGVLRDTEALKDILLSLAEELEAEGAFIRAFTPSPIPGRKGNREFFFLLGLERGLCPEELGREVEAVL